MRLFDLARELNGIPFRFRANPFMGLFLPIGVVPVKLRVHLIECNLSLRSLPVYRLGFFCQGFVYGICLIIEVESDGKINE